MLSMKVSTLRCSYLNKSNRVGLVPRGLHYRTKHGYEKGKSSREDRIFKVVVEKSSGRKREGERERAFDIFHEKGRNGAFGVHSPRRNLSSGNLVLCCMEILRASCFRDKKPRDSSWQPVTRYRRRRFNIYPQMEGSERGAKNATRETS